MNEHESLQNAMQDLKDNNSNFDCIVFIMSSIPPRDMYEVLLLW